MNISNSAYRSRLAQKNADRGTTQGFHHNPQDFSGLARGRCPIQEMKRNWDFETRAHRRLKTQMVVTYRGVRIDKNDQFELDIGN